MTTVKDITQILVIDADPTQPERLLEFLPAENGYSFSIAHASHMDAALERLPFHPADVVLIGLNSSDSLGTAGIKLLHETYPTVPIIAWLADVDEKTFAQIRIAGALDYLVRGCTDPEIWVRTMRYATEHGRLYQQLHQAESELERRSSTDPLTGLLNRRGIEQSLLRELHLCRTCGEDLLVLLVDLDNFNRINTVYDRAMGDTVLQNAAARIRSIIADPNTVGRAGGDQFLVLLPQMSVEDGMVNAERIRLAIARDRIPMSGKAIMMTASVGLTKVPADTLTINEVLADAHVALHRSKTLGKNLVCGALPSAGENTLPQLVVVSGELLRSLLYEGTLRVLSQPIVCLDSGEVVAREMLIRGPEGALHEPTELFRYCFEKDILTPVDLHCLEMCATVAEQQKNSNRIHLNIMPTTLMETPTDELVKLLAPRDGALDFCLEICEQQLFADPAHLVPAVRTLQEAGIKIAMDDVGFGKSCLEGLLMLRPEILKIDKKLIIGLSEDRAMRVALKRLLKVTEVLDTEVIAEGVESENDLNVLLDFGVHFGQGYYFGYPKNPPDENDNATVSNPSSTLQ